MLAKGLAYHHLCKVREAVLRFLAAPLAALFGLGVEFRILLYRLRILKRSNFSIPTIGVGNLSVGGAGKTPHSEYLVRLLSPYFSVGTLSRGYGRKTSGFRMVSPQDTAVDVGDEPLQMRRKFPELVVAVAEDRVMGISRLMQNAPQTRLVVLDDVYQHLAVKPSINLLLTEYDRPYWEDQLVPVGRLREWASAASRADAIIVSKCPAQLSTEERAALRKSIAPDPYQKIFFSKYRYGQPWYLLDPFIRTQLRGDLEVLVLTAIARVDYLLEYLDTQVARVHELSFSDHYDFKRRDIGRMASLFKEINATQKIILTTEKDAMRLIQHEAFFREQRLPIFVLPLEVEFLPQAPGEEDFDSYIKKRLLDFKA